MKYFIITAVIVLFTFSSCEDFLEVYSETELWTATFFKSQGDFEKAINGAYEPLRTLYFSGPNSSTGAWIMGEMHSDNTRYIFNPNYRAGIDQEQTADFIYNSASVAATGRYQTTYLVVARVNEILARIDMVDFDFDQNAKNNVKGQALFLRALSYFDLVQYFGEVPLHLTPTTSLDEVSLPLSGVDEIYDQIILDATEAASLLPEKSDQEPGRATSGAANTLLGNVYIVLKDYAAAETVLVEVVTSTEYQLLDDYAAIFDPANKNHLESVFEVQFLEGSQGYASNFIYSFFPQPITAEELTTLMAKYGVTPGNIQALNQDGFNIPTPDLISAYENGDLRKDVSIGYGVANGTKYPFVLKYLSLHSTAGITNDNWPIYRYSEVLLLLAEALNEQGKSEALTYLNMVHNHPRTGLVAITTTDQSQLRDLILQERRVELAFENKRWLDLVRTGKVEEVISAYGQNVKSNPQNYYFPAGISPVSAAFGDFRKTFPLPAAEALLNPYF